MEIEVSAQAEEPRTGWRDEVGAEPQAYIEDHALIGNKRTAALIARNGSLDFMCAPRFDSDACFASLLGNDRHGRWKIAPTVPVRSIQRRYHRDSLVLETDFVTDGGLLRVTDFMPLEGDIPYVVRRLKCLRGQVPVRSDCRPRFEFGLSTPRLLEQDGGTVAYVGADALCLRGGPGRGVPDLRADFTLSNGEHVDYVLSWHPSYEAPAPGIDPTEAERKTDAYWQGWCLQIRPPAMYRDEVVRSLITLKACIYEPSGGIVAAPTTSLPEQLGGPRNWDYRFCWLRDASGSMSPFLYAGLEDEALGFFRWINRATGADPSQIQIMYGLNGERRLTEQVLGWLPGYEGSPPVRLGNEASEQFQLDVPGEVASCVFLAAQRFPDLRDRAFQALLNAGQYVQRHWQRLDQGVWEVRGPQQAFTSSKASAWQAINCVVRAIEELGCRGDPKPWRALRDQMAKEILSKGFNAKLNTFTQYYGSTNVDASGLFLGFFGLVPMTDPRMLGTISAIERELMDRGLVLRYQSNPAIEGLPGETGKEGTFLACSFWLSRAYAAIGRTADSTKLFEHVLSLQNDVGLLAEEYEPTLRRQLGNFPQAFSHFALVNNAYELQAMSQRHAIH